jgi:hypothetical protein
MVEDQLISPHRRLSCSQIWKYHNYLLRACLRQLFGDETGACKLFVNDGRFFVGHGKCDAAKGACKYWPIFHFGFSVPLGTFGDCSVFENGAFDKLQS